MTKPQRILTVEIRTSDNPGLDSSQLSTLTAHSNSKGELSLSSIDTIRSAIVDGIIHLGSNYRHPLLFDVQVLPSDDIDTSDPNLDKSPSKGRRRRRRGDNN